MEKLNKSAGQSMDIVADNIAKLKELFPEILTENKIDFDTLKALLGEEIEVEDERYSFNWHGKAQARRLAQSPSTGTLRPCKEDSVDWDTTQNLFIEGDNLEVLKLLQKSYHKQVKMIYIDPPYNTGGDFVYPDDFKDNISNYKKITGQLDIKNRPKSTNNESSGRFHTDWLNMIYPRLKLAKNLLTKDGVIFVSIDENEYQNLRAVMDEIFGEENFRNTFYVRRYDKNLNQQFIEKGLKSFNVGLEQIVAYSLSDEFNFNAIYREASEERAGNGYWKGFWNAPDRPTMRYEILGYEPISGQWKWSKDKALVAVKNYENYLENFSSKMSLEDYWADTGKSLQFIRRNLNGVGMNKGVENWIAPSSGILRSTLWSDLLASKTNADMEGAFSFAKNLDLLKLIVQAGSDEGSIVLDFFAGSGTTAHAVLSENAEDAGNRKFILVQLPEPLDSEKQEQKAGAEFCDGLNKPRNIAELTKERLRRSAKKISVELSDSQGDLGFKVFKLDSSNLKPWDADFDSLAQDLAEATEVVKAERGAEDVLFEILLKYGLDLTLPIATHTLEGKTVYEVGAGALVVCLDSGITEAVAEAIGKLKETLEPEVMRVVFKDSSFANDAAKVNAVQVLKQFGIDDVKSI